MSIFSAWLAARGPYSMSAVAPRHQSLGDLITSAMRAWVEVNVTTPIMFLVDDIRASQRAFEKDADERLLDQHKRLAALEKDTHVPQPVVTWEEFDLVRNAVSQRLCQLEAAPPSPDPQTLVGFMNALEGRMMKLEQAVTPVVTWKRYYERLVDPPRLGTDLGSAWGGKGTQPKLPKPIRLEMTKAEAQYIRGLLARVQGEPTKLSNSLRTKFEEAGIQRTASMWAQFRYYVSYVGSEQ